MPLRPKSALNIHLLHAWRAFLSILQAFISSRPRIALHYYSVHAQRNKPRPKMLSNINILHAQRCQAHNYCLAYTMACFSLSGPKMGFLLNLLHAQETFGSHFHSILLFLLLELSLACCALHLISSGLFGSRILILLLTLRPLHFDVLLFIFRCREGEAPLSSSPPVLRRPLHGAYLFIYVATS